MKYFSPEVSFRNLYSSGGEPMGYVPLRAITGISKRFAIAWSLRMAVFTFPREPRTCMDDKGKLFPSL